MVALLSPEQQTWLQPWHCCCRLQMMDAEAAAEVLDGAFSTVLPLLATNQEDVRFAAGQALKNLIHDCVHAADGGPADVALDGLVTSLGGALGPTYQDVWPEVLSGVETLPHAAVKR